MNKFRRSAKQTLAVYWHYLKQHPYMLFAVLSMSAVAIVLQNTVRPYIAAEVVDKVASENFDPDGNVWSEFGFYILIFAGLQIASNILWRSQGYVFAHLISVVTKKLEAHVFDWLSKHSYNFFADAFSGALVAQARRFVGSFQRIFLNATYEVFRISIIVIFTIAVLLVEAPEVGVFMILWSILFLSISVSLNVRKSKHTRAYAEADSAVTARLADFITNILTVKVFASSKYEKRTFDERIDDKRIKDRRIYWINENIYGVQMLMTMIAYTATWTYSLHSLLEGTMTIGTVLLIFLYLGIIMRDLFFVGRVISQVESALSEANEMSVILHTLPSVVDPVEPEKLAISDGDIEFNNVSFAYDNNAKLFRKLNLSIKSGEKVGLVGPSGGGKTSVTKLLLRFLDIQSGEILIDGQNITNLTQDDLRSVISYVPQEPLLFHRSLTENIGYVQNKPKKADIIVAAKHARAHRFINKLPKKYETLVGERGIKLSGGEKQRVAIARAVLKDVPILILDEATSALDSESEKLIQEALEDLMKDKTAIVIAHRLSTIQKMDRIIVLDEGRIVEEGSHKDLLKNKGLYSDLWSHQSGGFLDS